MNKQQDHSRAFHRPLAWTHNDPRGWTTASIFTSLGVVAVYMQGGDDPYTSLDFVWEGRIHTREFHGKTFTERGLTTVANRFAKEIVHGY